LEEQRTANSSFIALNLSMQTTITEEIEIVHTTNNDLQNIFWLFEQAMKLQGKNGYKVWNNIGKEGLVKDIENGLQYKIVKDN